MKRAYLFSAFYSSAAKYKSTLAEINTTVRQVSSGNMHVLMAGTGGLLIGFTSGLPLKQLTARLSRFGDPIDETFSYMVVQISVAFQGTMSAGSMEWALAHFPRPQKEEE